MVDLFKRSPRRATRRGKSRQNNNTRTRRTSNGNRRRTNRGGLAGLFGRRKRSARRGHRTSLLKLLTGRKRRS